MIRNLKTLGLALVAGFALSAMVASAASAQGKFTSDGPVTWTATETGPAGSNAFTAFGATVECAGTTYTGHAYNVTPHASLPSGVTTATLTPKYPKCVSKPSGRPTTVDMNGCDYVIHIGATKDKANTYLLTFDVVCPAGKEVTVTFFTTDPDHVNGTPFCVWHIQPQTGLTGLHATDTKNGHIDITGAVEKVHITRVSPGDTHLLLCNSLTTTEGKIDIDVTVKGHNQLGAPTEISLSD
ncbi:MAG: hypothetical protein WA687_02505 [Solirubrobacterales bacterium]